MKGPNPARGPNPRLILACEYARRPRCECACGGTAHGKKRGIPLWELPEDDPHFVRLESCEAANALLERVGRALAKALAGGAKDA